MSADGAKLSGRAASFSLWLCVAYTGVVLVTMLKIEVETAAHLIWWLLGFILAVAPVVLPLAVAMKSDERWLHVLALLTGVTMAGIGAVCLTGILPLLGDWSVGLRVLATASTQILALSALVGAVLLTLVVRGS